MGHLDRQTILDLEMKIAFDMREKNLFLEKALHNQTSNYNSSAKRKRKW